VNGGLVGTCKCLSRWLPVDEDSSLRFCIFSAQLPAERHAFHPSFTPYPHLIKSNCLCHCSDILVSDQDTTTTVFCLNRSSKITSRVSYSQHEFSKAHCFLLRKSLEIEKRK